jgi:anti-anti-sigma factor
MCIDCIPAPSGRIAIEVAAGQSATTIFIRGELDLVSMPFLNKCLTQVLGEKPGQLVVDMAGTDFIDCGCARLIAGASQALPPGARLVIRHPSSGVLRILELTGLDDYCEIEG